MRVKSSTLVCYTLIKDIAMWVGRAIWLLHGLSTLKIVLSLKIILRTLKDFDIAL